MLNPLLFTSILLALSATHASASNLRIGEPVKGAPAATANPLPKPGGYYYSLPTVPQALAPQLPQTPALPITQNPPPPPQGLVVEDITKEGKDDLVPLTDENLNAIYNELVGDEASPKTEATSIPEEQKIYLPTTAPKNLLAKEPQKAPDRTDELAEQTKMAISYLTGKGDVPANPDLAMTLLKQAAGQDYAEAQFWLGEAYTNGLGVEKNPKRAFSWYAQAADLGYTPAQMKLSTLYMLGSGIRFNVQKAYEWLEIASLSGNPDADFVKQTLKSQLTPQQLNDAEANARNFKPRKPLTKMSPRTTLDDLSQQRPQLRRN